jgi:pimeloyl-ACP methyl ester carboxylesterase
MNPRRTLALLGTAAGIGGAALGLYRATHPSNARGSDRPDPGRARPFHDDALYDLPDDVTSATIDTPDGGTIHYVERGSGQPLVLLHGVTLRASVWAPQFHQLTDRFRVIAVDLRGHGGSTAGTAGFGLSRLGDDLATLLEHLDLHDAIVVGHSMGGMTVMTFCAEHPDVLAARVAGVAFVATTASHVYPPLVDGPLRRLVGRGRSMVDGGRSLPGGAQVDPRIARLAFGQHPNPRAVRIVAKMGSTMDPAAMLASVDQMFDHDTRAALRATDTPSMVVVGTRDLLTPVPAARALAALLPDCDFVVLPRAGHQLMQERPEELADLLTGFADRVAGAVPDLASAVAADGVAVDDADVEIDHLA